MDCRGIYLDFLWLAWAGEWTSSLSTETNQLHIPCVSPLRCKLFYVLRVPGVPSRQCDGSHLASCVGSRVGNDAFVRPLQASHQASEESRVGPQPFWTARWLFKLVACLAVTCLALAKEGSASVLTGMVILLKSMVHPPSQLL